MNLMFQPITYFQLLVLVVLTRMAINLNPIMDSIFFTFRYFLKTDTASRFSSSLGDKK